MLYVVFVSNLCPLSLDSCLLAAPLYPMCSNLLRLVRLGHSLSVIVCRVPFKYVAFRYTLNVLHVFADLTYRVQLSWYRFDQSNSKLGIFELKI